jgi:asparagine synthase (glutamine-hydrolysing)
MATLIGCHKTSLTEETVENFLKHLGDIRGSSLASVAGTVAAAFGGSVYHAPDGAVAVIVGFPRWRNPELAKIAVNEGHARALSEAYRCRGERFWTELGGAFSLAIIDTVADKVLLAIDRIGQQHLFYAATEHGLVFGSRADHIIAHPDVSAEISDQALYDYIYFHHCPSPSSIFRSVKKLEGGQYLRYSAGRISVETYWMPSFDESLSVSNGEAEEQVRTAIFSAVSRFDTADRHIGAFLSGGLDSSTIAGALSRIRPHNTPTFSIGFPVKGYDEIDYARIAANHFGTKQHEYYLTPEDIVTAISKVAEACDEPFGNSSALPAYFCAKLAKENGITLLLAGDGGDELFAGNERYAKQFVFEHFRRLPHRLQKLIADGCNVVPPLLAQRFPLRKVFRYVEQAAIPLPDRLQNYNFLHRHDPKEVFTPDFLCSVDHSLPLFGLRKSYSQPEAATVLNRMLYLDWKITLHDNDLVKVNRMCELAQIDVAYPMLDDEVIECSCRIPSNLKIRQGRGGLRWFYKRAMRDFLPPQIINKSKHGFGLPFGIWLTNHGPLRELAYESIRQLKQRDIFLPSFLDQAVVMHQSIHAPYYGELIWILMMLEQWWQANERKLVGIKT